MPHGRRPIHVGATFRACPELVEGSPAAVPFAAGALAVTLLLSACNGGATRPPFLSETDTPATPSPGPAKLPPAAFGQFADTNDFRAFAQQLAAALNRAGTQFFLDNAVFSDLSCSHEFTAPPACAHLLDPRCDKSDPAYDPQFAAASCPVYQPPDATIPGITVAVFQSEGFGLDRAAFEDFMTEFLTTYDPAASDAYGDGKPRLYAYGVFQPEFAAQLGAVQAIATRIPGSPPENPVAPARVSARQALAFGADFDGQRWSIVHMAMGPSVGFLDPTSQEAGQVLGNVFQFWAPWEGASP